jgi:hypothetical protein
MSQVLDQVLQALRDAKWIPSDAIGRRNLPNLLPAISQAWEAACDDNIQPSTDDFRRWLDQQINQGASLQLLHSQRPEVSDWIGPRLLFAPNLGQPAISRPRLVGLASSRLGRRLDTQQAWFTMFRAACSKLDFQRETLFTAESTTTARFVRRAADLFDIPVLSLVTPSAKTTVVDWLRRLQTVDTDEGNVHRIYLSPELVPTPTTGPLATLPLRDRSVVALADRLLVFHLRSGGQLDALVRTRLVDARWPAGSVFVALGDGLVEETIADELLDRGAVGWIVLDTLRGTDNSPPAKSGGAPAAIVPLPLSDNWQFLTHCTRDQSGVWPDETEQQFFDGLLTGDAVEHSALATLERILRTQLLLATNQLVRGDTRVVSFTAVPLVDLPKMRTYRSHLGRWDFEPYGLCIRRECLSSYGAEPVRYGDESLWESLGEAQRPFFQKNGGRLDVDWSAEQEWRHIGDLDLSLLSNDEALVFVPSQLEAARIARISRWPVTVLSKP